MIKKLVFIPAGAIILGSFAVSAAKADDTIDLYFSTVATKYGIFAANAKLCDVPIPSSVKQRILIGLSPIESVDIAGASSRLDQEADDEYSRINLLSCDFELVKSNMESLYFSMDHLEDAIAKRYR